MRTLFAALAFAALCWNLASHSAAANATVTLPTLPQASETFDVGTLHVQRFGNGAHTIIFIPGLGCGPWSWAEQIAHFSASDTVYALTLPGFDGRPISGEQNLFGAFTHDFWSLLDERHIAKPIVVGHSLGGTLGIALAEDHPERLAGVVALDGLPIFPTLVQASSTERMAQAKALSQSIATETRAQELAYEIRFMQTIGTIQPDLVAPTAQLEANSDPKGVAAWLSADLNADLRPALAKATVPIAELMPYAKPSPYTKEQTLGFYQMLFTGAPKVSVVPIDGARHFAMLDQPQAVDAAITQFLASLP